uniref:Uncharacterized protein n=1 Tax=Anguilla anguilla TaxID=7936 RepID=A0A0E9WP27_ANGAN
MRFTFTPIPLSSARTTKWPAWPKRPAARPSRPLPTTVSKGSWNLSELHSSVRQLPTSRNKEIFRIRDTMTNFTEVHVEEQDYKNLNHYCKLWLCLKL